MAKKIAKKKRSVPAGKKKTSARSKEVKKVEDSSESKPKILQKTKLTAVQLKRFNDLLMDKRRLLMGDVSELESDSFNENISNRSGDLSRMPTHPADAGTDNFEHEFSLELLESERTLLDEINLSLDRIRNKTYGICLGTGGMIGLARLKARPWTRYSIDYARLIEKGLASERDEIPTPEDLD